MTWYYDIAADGSTVDVYDHTGSLVLTVNNPNAPMTRRDAQGVPVVPDVRQEIVSELVERGQADVYALLAVAEALTGAAFEEGVPS
jgi:hypothetical protein